MKQKSGSSKTTSDNQGTDKRLLRSRSDIELQTASNSSQNINASKASMEVEKGAITKAKSVGNGSKRPAKQETETSDSDSMDNKRQKIVASRSSPRNIPSSLSSPDLSRTRRNNLDKDNLTSTKRIESDDQSSEADIPSSSSVESPRTRTRTKTSSTENFSKSADSRKLLETIISHKLQENSSDNSKQSSRSSSSDKGKNMQVDACETVADKTERTESKSNNANSNITSQGRLTRKLSNASKMPSDEVREVKGDVSKISTDKEIKTDAGKLSSADLKNSTDKNKIDEKNNEIIDCDVISDDSSDDFDDDDDDDDDNDEDDDDDDDSNDSNDSDDSQSDDDDDDDDDNDSDDESDEDDESDLSEDDLASDDSEIMIVDHTTNNKHKVSGIVNGGLVKTNESSDKMDELLSVEASQKMSKEKLCTLIKSLQESLSSTRRNYRRDIRKKNDELEKVSHSSKIKVDRLKSELKWKDEQIEELNKVAEKNMETEAKISYLLSDKEAYEREVVEYNKPKPAKKTTPPVDQKEVAEEESTAGGEGEESSGRRKRRGRKRGGGKGAEGNEAEDLDVMFVGKDEAIVVQDEEGEGKGRGEENQGGENTGENTDVPERVMSLIKNKDQGEETTDGDDSAAKGRHEIRQLMSRLQEETKIAGKKELDRRDRIKKEREKHLIVTEMDEKLNQPVCSRMVLSFKDEEKKQARVEVNKKIVCRLKPHQVEAVEFMWDNLLESMDVLLDKEKEESKGSGCILAHCMGLGKTLSVIALVHTLLTTKEVGFNKCLILSPLNAVLNWVAEWGKWTDKRQRIKVYELSTRAAAQDRNKILSDWLKKGGLLVVSYQLFRLLVSYSGRSKKLRSLYDSCFIDPGPDVLVCDEGHILKNDSSALSKCVTKICTRRRIVLTGTPLQNNLIEYHCMVSLVKPNLLGTRKEFANRFVNPITNGQHSDSTANDVKLMKRRAHVLHEMLSGCVQRRDYTALVKFLPPKHEYVILIRLSDLQIELYENYLSRYASNSAQPDGIKGTGAGLFTDYQYLMRIWTHPWVLKMEQERQDRKPLTFDDDDELESVLFTSSSDEENDDVDNNDDDINADDDENETRETKTETQKSEIVKRSVRSTRNKTKNNNEDKNNDDAEDDGSKNDDDDDDDVDGKDDDDESVDFKLKPIKSAQSKKNKKSKRNSDQKTKPELNSLKDKKPATAGGESQSASASDGEGESKPVNGERKAKIFAGEVIRQWQSKTRGKGQDNGEDEVGSGRVREEPWWSKMLSEEHREQLELSGKLVLLFEILRMSEQMGDKVLVFSQSLLSLDLIENFLSYKTLQAEKHNSELRRGGVEMSVWKKDEDYLRMDGSTGAVNRTKYTNNFNDPENTRLRLFLISTKAGGLGINLGAANRVIIFDASWNPSHDVQSIFRVYRFGQLKPCFIYRFLAQGTMEEKIYDRQVTKETLSHRVVDEHQIDRHFTAADLQELYMFKPDRYDDPEAAAKRPVPAVPKDVILAELLTEHKRWILQYHEHDSLLENRPEENLSEAERLAAWEEYEKERVEPLFNQPIMSGFRPSIMQMTFANRSYAYPSNTLTTFPNNAMIRFGSGQQFPYQPIRTGFVQFMPSTVSVSVANQMASKVKDATALAIDSIPEGLRGKFSFQISQLPRVVQEILKYNPNISVSDLQSRLHAFLGMHSRFSSNAHQQQLQQHNLLIKQQAATTSATSATASVPATAATTTAATETSSGRKAE